MGAGDASQRDGASLPERPPGPDAEVWCMRCGYDLQGVASRSCPECGEPFDPVELRRPHIPWSHRRQVGRLRAYWSTVFLVTFSPSRLCREIARPVSYAEARWFQVVTTAHLWATALVAPVVEEVLELSRLEPIPALGWGAARFSFSPPAECTRTGSIRRRCRCVARTGRWP
jgi:hypothetical protein